MNILDQSQLSIISAGNAWIIAATTSVTVYSAAGGIINTTQTLNAFGHTIGEQTYNLLNPDPLGQMIYPIPVQSTEVSHLLIDNQS